MGAAFFYHLTESPLEEALPLLLGKALDAGWRIEVRGTDTDRLKELDTKLWGGADDGFLPHGVEGGKHDARQPILLTSSHNRKNNPTCVVAVHGAKIAPEEVEGLERAMVVFDATIGDEIQQAREQWKALTGAGCTAQYWAQEGHRWVKKAES
ncbi:DNA polymerase III subunit chi [Marivivens donghaensis]|uniref:DNA polymerase III subunit chi n=1 Tax=Marivivens donghaensis TaxID=1699413 RepID=A0ABX0W221_9RHOB|nr:DNA polymerase III subunit chi [Marivivens donghaensis]NIY72958.1 DNA polymerase III subunit chi [Marivivens donghaensis]